MFYPEVLQVIIVVGCWLLVAGAGVSTRADMLQRAAQYFIRAAPQVNPPPKASSSMVSPRLMRPERTATSSAIGTDAADVLPCMSTVTTTRSIGMSSLRAVALMMRRLA